MKKVNIYWSRRDFRLHDNPALYECVQNCRETHSEFLPIFILENYMLKAEPKFQFGYPSRYFLAKALPEFGKHFENFLLLKGRGAETILEMQTELISKYKNGLELQLYVNEDVYIDFYKQIKKLKKHNIVVKVFNDQLTVDKETKSNNGLGNYYSVFTPFKKAVWKEFLNSKVLPKPDLKSLKYVKINHINKVENTFETIWHEFSKNRKLEILVENKKEVVDIEQLLDFKPDFQNLENFIYEEFEAQKHFKKYLEHELRNYKENRDSLEKDQTSKMSLPLAWGLVSARYLKKEIVEHFDDDFSEINWFKIDDKLAGSIQYISELIWREFYKYLFHHKPELMNEEFQEKFRYKVKWVDSKIAKERFQAWIKGETGYKIVDAAMMQLAKTGWMHNRARMIVASVLTKNLGVDWRWGQEYFRAMLLDLDEASNNGGWQWGASVGADPKPIRIFNPYLQAENYDKKNIYQKKWLGDDRFFFGPEPLVDHKVARNDALKRYGLSQEKDGEVRDY